MGARATGTQIGVEQHQDIYTIDTGDCAVNALVSPVSFEKKYERLKLQLSDSVD